MCFHAHESQKNLLSERSQLKKIPTALLFLYKILGDTNSSIMIDWCCSGCWGGGAQGWGRGFTKGHK